MEPISPEPPDPAPPDPTLTMTPMEISVSTKKRHLDSDFDRSNPKKTITNTETASASIQTVYTDPALTVLGIKYYLESDTGPYLVHVSRIVTDPAAGSTLKPIKFGQFLYTNKIQDICQDGVKRVGRNKIAIKFKSASGANKFLENPILKLYQFEAFIPTYNVTRMGLVRGVPVDLSMEDFAKSIQIPGNDLASILKARRLNRKVKNGTEISWEPTQTVVLTFRCQYLPDRVYSFYSSLPVEAYVFPTIQCLNCCRFGHIKAQCRSAPRCYRCAQPHPGDECNVIEAEASCLCCSGRHFSTDKCCPEQGRQKAIKVTMSREGISYEEAMTQFPKSPRPFNEVMSAPSTSSPTPSQPQQTYSYKKTVYSQPRARAPLGKSYDKVAHQAIVATEPSSLPNGHALQLSQSSSHPDQESLSQNQLLMQLLTIIINIISQNSGIPPNVAQTISQLTALLNYNGSLHDNPVELQKSPQEKA